MAMFMKVTVECDEPGCHAVLHTTSPVPGGFGGVGRPILEHEGWTATDMVPLGPVQDARFYCPLHSKKGK